MEYQNISYLVILAIVLFLSTYYYFQHNRQCKTQYQVVQELLNDEMVESLEELLITLNQQRLMRITLEKVEVIFIISLMNTIEEEIQTL